MKSAIITPLARILAPGDARYAQVRGVESAGSRHTYCTSNECLRT